MPTNDRQRKKVIYPYLRRARRPEEEAGSVTVVSETIIRTTEVLTLGSPGLFIQNAYLAVPCEIFTDPFTTVLVVTSSGLAAGPPA